LRFVINRLAYTQQRCHRIEQASHAGSPGRVQTAAQLSIQGGQCSRTCALQFPCVAHRRQVFLPSQLSLRQPAERHAPGLAYRQVAARQARISQVGGAPVPVIICDQHFSAPHRAVIPVAGAIESQPDYRLVPT